MAVSFPYSLGVLAYLGDSVLSLQVRLHLAELGHRRLAKMVDLANQFVSAKSQADFYDQLETMDLPADCKDILRRGYNYKSHSRAKNTDYLTYKKATALEVLWGYLYVDKQRALLTRLWDEYKTFTRMKYGTMDLRQE